MKKAKIDWESEFNALYKYVDRLEKMNNGLLKQNIALTELMEKIVDGNPKS